MAEYDEEKLNKLGELKDYEVADDDPDVRGWDVVTSDNKKIGKVEELIVDIEAMKVRYLSIRVNDDISGVNDHKLLLPIGTASIDEKEDVVRADTVETVTILKYPRYEGGRVTRDYEDSIQRSFNPDFKRTENDRDYYSSRYYDDERFYSSRRRKKLFGLKDIKGQGIERIDPDMTNWDVESRDGKRIGSVYDLIVDPKIKKIRYIEVASVVDRGTADEDQHFLIPVGLASINEIEDKITVKLDYTDLARFPLYRGGEITRTYEDTLRNSIRMNSLTSRDPDEEYYDNEYYNEQGFYGRRGSGIRWI